MNQDEIINMAVECGFYGHSKNFFDCTRKQIQAFAKLVEAKERESLIAMEVDLAASPALFATMNEWHGYKHGIETFIAAIRARG